MRWFVTAVPLFNTEMAVDAYKFNYQNGEKLFVLAKDYTVLDEAMSSPSLDLLKLVGVEPFTGGKPIFVEITKYLLLMDFANTCTVPPELMICVLSNDIPTETLYFEKCLQLKKRGFRIALQGIESNSKTEFLFSIADYIMYDIENESFIIAMKNIRIKMPHLRAVILNVSSKETFETLKAIPQTLFQGKFYNQPMTKGVSGISPLKANALQLLKVVGEDDFDLAAVSHIVQQDPALSIALLKFINSPTVGVHTKVTSIQNAVALLGQKETKKWVAVAVSTYISEDKPSELTKLSLTRGKFAENLASAFEMGIHAPSLFLMGLFSLLDVILDKTMDAAVKEIAVNDTIREALVSKRGPFYKVLDLMYHYEQADWQSVSYSLIINNISVKAINKAYVDSLIWYRDLLVSIQ